VFVCVRFCLINIIRVSIFNDVHQKTSAISVLARVFAIVFAMVYAMVFAMPSSAYHSI
jgi:hypothetical protein